MGIEITNNRLQIWVMLLVKLFNQDVQIFRHFIQFINCWLGLIGATHCLSCQLRKRRDTFGYLVAAFCCFLHVSADFIRCNGLFLNGRGNGSVDFADFQDVLIIWIALFVLAWISSMRAFISSVVEADCLASSFTSLATTVKPFPASPALAASMVALRASRSVWETIPLMTSSAFWVTAAALVAFLAISFTLIDISSVAVATVCRSALTCSDAAEILSACDELFSVSELMFSLLQFTGITSQIWGVDF